MNQKTLHKILIIFLCTCNYSLSAQNVPIEGQKRIFFPHPMDRSWQASVGFIATTMPHEITEELRFRIPAGDFHFLKNLSGRLYLDGRLTFQAIQNLVTVGPRWAVPLNDRTSVAVGSDIGFWFGFVNIGGLRTKGHGWQNYPNVSVGYRFNRSILLTLKAESMMNFAINTRAGETEVDYSYRLFSGSSYAILLEQPFYGNKSLTLGFKAIYTSFLWQTWTLFESYDRNLFFPQLIVGLIL